MLQILDVLLTLLHLVVIIFNLTGWIWKSTRAVHFYCIVATASSWLFLGIWFGVGYCPITDWQWKIKEKLGEEDLPTSFIKYFADKVTGEKISATSIDYLTAIFFLISAALSVYFYFGNRSQARNR